MATPPPQQPIGYWLKKADTLLTARIDAVQQANGLTRLDWQMLNVIRDAEATPAHLAATLKPFADAEQVAGRLTALAARGLVAAAGPGTYTLTDAGAALYHRALEAQQGVRKTAFAGLSEADYHATLHVLQTLVANLEGGDSPGPFA